MRILNVNPYIDPITGGGDSRKNLANESFSGETGARCHRFNDGYRSGMWVAFGVGAS